MSRCTTGKVYGEKKKKTLWEEICDEFAAKKAAIEESDFDDASSIETDITQFSARRHTPVVYGRMVHHTPVDANAYTDFDPAVGHPAAIGLSILTKPKPPPSPPPPIPPDPKTCTPKEYLENYIFPTLLPALTAMLQQAKIERCFERKRFRFNGCDYLTEYLYKHNQSKDLSEREPLTLYDIPFVKTLLEKHPRAPLPLSLQWSEDEAAIKIQSFFRGHMVRIQPEVCELRQWQKDWREENRNVREKIDKFWEQHEPKGRLVQRRHTLQNAALLQVVSSGLIKRSRKIKEFAAN